MLREGGSLSLARKGGSLSLARNGVSVQSLLACENDIVGDREWGAHEQLASNVRDAREKNE